MGCSEGGNLEWNVSVLLPWVLQLLALQHVQVLAHLLSGLRWSDDVVNESSDGGWERVAEQLGVLLLVLDGVLLIVTEEDRDGSLSSHNSNLGSWPGVVDISTKMLGRHDIVGSSERLAGDDGDLWNGGLGESVEELGSVADDTSVLLGGSWQKSWNIDQGDDWDVEGIAEADEASSLHGRVDVEASSRELWIVSDDSDGTSIHSGETDDQILSVVWHDLEEVTLINESVDDILHVVGSGAFQWNNSVKGWDWSVPWILSGTDW